jgi:site-specific recombinase XerC
MAARHLEAHPGDYESPRRMLGHKSIDTTTNFYTGLETAAAARLYDESLLKRRREAEIALGLRPPRTKR